MTVEHILSIQSHVVFGHVGNAAATFPLQRMGFEVWPLHTCMLSNHTGYPAIKGTAIRGEIFVPAVLDDIVRMLGERGLLAKVSGILSGWLGKADLGKAVLGALSMAKRHANVRPPLYLCDPVLGDDDVSMGEGRLYAAADIPAFFCDHLLPVADIITPNRFELAYLSDQTVGDQSSAIIAARTLLGRSGPQTLGRGPWLCVVTSLMDPSDPNAIGCLAVTQEAAWRVSTPRLSFEQPVSGTGDCLAAFLLGHVLRGASPAEALSRAVSALYAVLEHTQAAQTSGPARPELALPELALIAAQDDFIAPARSFAAVPLT